jgi:FKBP-type peptidyl-prolyl cis-trans isomerase
MASYRERAFAWMGVIVFTISAVALTVAVVAEQIIQDRNNNSAAQSQAQAQQQAAACTDDSNSEPTLPKPDVYKASSVPDLQITDLTTGTGAAAKASDCVNIKYYGTLASSGTMFDENFTKPTGLAFKVGAEQVIKGMDTGVVGMKVGGERRLVIPAAQAYGSQASGPIPANSNLVFVVKLLRIKQ